MRMEQNILILTVNEDTKTLWREKEIEGMLEEGGNPLCLTSSFENAPANNDKILPGAKETTATDSFWVTPDHLWVSVIDVT